MSLYNMRSPANTVQTIEFSTDDADTTVEVFGSDVTVVCGGGSGSGVGGGPHPLASSKVCLNNIVDYCWEERFHLGQLLAVHMEAKFIAYAIKAMGKTNSVIRILNRDTGERGLIKSVEGMVEDLAFARLPAPHIILALVDHHGTLLVHQIMETDTEIATTLLLHVNQSKEVPVGVPHRVFWCSYIPEEDGGQDAYYDEISRLLAVTRNNKIEMWNVGIVSENHGQGPFVAGDVEEGYLEIEAHSNLIVDAAFSPDGTAIATASLDGDCKFYQVYMQPAGSGGVSGGSNSGGGVGSDPRCLHQWQPHGGKPLSALFFLDDHRNYNPDIQFWKFAVTGADNNSEIKLWSCETWKCLQTIRFTSRSPPPPPTKLKASMDLSAGYILMTDLYHRLLYVLELKKENNETFPFVRSLTEFKLPCPIISFGVVDAGPRTFKTNTQPFMLEDLCTSADGDDDTGGSCYGSAVVIRMYIVQPKSFQECHIVFQTPQANRTLNHHNQRSNSSNHTQPIQSAVYEDDQLGDLDLTMKDNNTDLIVDPAGQQPEHISLMTPDAFSSPLNKHTSPVIGSVSPIDDSNVTDFGGVTIPQTSPTNDSTAVMCFTSGGSSPSREVQEIMSLQDSPCYYLEGMTPANMIKMSVSAEGGRGEGDGGSEWRPLPQAPPLPPASKWCVNLQPKSPEVAKLITKSVGSGPEAGGQQHYASASSIQHLEAAMANMRMDLAAIVITIQEQSKQIQELREELKRKDERTRVLLEGATDRWLEALKLDREEAEARRRQEPPPAPPPPPQVKCALDQPTLAATLSQIVADSAVVALNRELQAVVKPALLSTLNELKEMLATEVSKKLTTTDQLLKESISKMVRNKHVLEAVSNSLLASATPAMSECYKETFTQAVPMFERACDNMFKQMIATFSTGTEEYVKEIERYSERASARSQEEIVALRAASESMTSAAQQFVTNIERTTKKLEDSIVDAVTRGVRGSLNNGSIAAAVVRSRTVTPAPSGGGASTPHHHQVVLDTQLIQTQLLQLIAQGQYNSAFQQALSAADLSIVMYVCERVAPHQVFTQSGPLLQQHVLLSLIQQLSADMNHHTEIRHRYLEEAVMNLDPKNSATREHMPAVLSALHKQLQLYISLHPNAPIAKRVRMLQMATQSLLA